jgi:hypothetical protein
MKTNEVELTQLIKSQDWLSVYQNKEVNNAINIFTEILNTIKISASKEIQISSKIKKIKPWATTTLIKTIRKRDHLHSQVRKHPHNNQLKDYYLKYRNMVTLLIRNTKKFTIRLN